MKRKLSSFFGVVINGQTYLNIVYLLLSFPLGIAYFAFLVAGLSVGLGLLATIVGIPILLIMVAAWRGLLAFERQLAMSLLDVEIPPILHRPDPRMNVWGRIKRMLQAPVTWKGLGYLFIKFPLGVVSLVLIVTLIAICIAFFAVPLLALFGPESWIVLTLDSIALSLLFVLIGILIAVSSMHMINGIAFVEGKIAVGLLRSREPYVSAKKVKKASAGKKK